MNRRNKKSCFLLRSVGRGEREIGWEEGRGEREKKIS